MQCTRPCVWQHVQKGSKSDMYRCIETEDNLVTDSIVSVSKKLTQK